MFVPVRIGVGAGGETAAAYDRTIEFTARQFAAFEHEAGDMTEPLTMIGTDLHTQVSAQFATEGAQGATGPWAQLSEDYGEWKAAHSAAPILVGLRPTGPAGSRPQSYEPDGEMRRELLDPLATHISPQRLLYEPVSEIAGYHETGTDDMPARPPVDLGPEFLHSIDRQFVRWVATLVERAGL